MVRIVIPPPRVDLDRAWLKIHISGCLLGEEDDGSDFAKERKDAKRNMISGASLEASFTDVMFLIPTYVSGFEKNHFLFH